MTHKLILFAAAAALSGCASMDAPSQQTASLEGAVYASNDGDTLKQPVATADAAASAAVPGAPKQMRIYWFLGGR